MQTRDFVGDVCELGGRVAVFAIYSQGKPGNFEKVADAVTKAHDQASCRSLDARLRFATVPILSNTLWS